MNLFIAARSRQSIQNVLQPIAGLTIQGFASDTTEAVRSILELRPDIVLLDIRADDAQAFEVLQQVKQISPASMVMVITDTPSRRSMIINAGADYCFDEATEFDRLFAICSRLGSPVKYHFPN